MKCCNNCHIEKPYSEFYKDKYATDGYQYKCKQCNKQISKNQYHKNPEYFKQHHKQFIQANVGYNEQLSKQFRLSKQLPYWIVYLLPKENYVGITNNPYYRTVS